MSVSNGSRSRSTPRSTASAISSAASPSMSPAAASASSRSGGGSPKARHRAAFRDPRLRRSRRPAPGRGRRRQRVRWPLRPHGQVGDRLRRRLSRPIRRCGARYLAGNTDMMKVRGSRHDTGEVLRMLIDLGARPAGQWQSGHMSPIDANAPDFETPAARGRPRQHPEPLRLSRTGSASTALGLRFFDEGEAQHSLHLCQDRPRRARPARRDRLPDLRSDRHQVLPLSAPQARPSVEAGTIAELATKVGTRADGARAHG